MTIERMPKEGGRTVPDPPKPDDDDDGPIDEDFLGNAEPRPKDD